MQNEFDERVADEGGWVRKVCEVKKSWQVVWCTEKTGTAVVFLKERDDYFC